MCRDVWQEEEGSGISAKAVTVAGDIWKMEVLLSQKILEGELG